MLTTLYDICIYIYTGAMEIVNLHGDAKNNIVTKQLYKDIVDVGIILSSAIDRLRRQAQVVKYRRERNQSVRQLKTCTVELKKANARDNLNKVEIDKKNSLLHRAIQAEKGLDSLTEAIKLSENELRKSLKRESNLKEKLKNLEPEVAKVRIENKTLIKEYNAKLSKMENKEKEHKKELMKVKKRLEKAEMQLRTVHGARNMKNSELHRKLGVAINQKISAENKLRRVQNALHSSKSELKMQLGDALKRADEQERISLALESELKIFKSKSEGQINALLSRAEKAEQLCDEMTPALSKINGDTITLKMKYETSRHEHNKLSAIIDVLKKSLLDSRNRTRALELTLAEYGIDQKHWNAAKGVENVNITNNFSLKKSSSPLLQTTTMDISMSPYNNILSRSSPPSGKRGNTFGSTLDQMEATLAEARQFTSRS